MDWHESLVILSTIIIKGLETSLTRIELEATGNGSLALTLTHQNLLDRFYQVYDHGTIKSHFLIILGRSIIKYHQELGNFIVLLEVYLSSRPDLIRLAACIVLHKRLSATMRLFSGRRLCKKYAGSQPNVGVLVE